MTGRRPTHKVKCHKCMATFPGSREDAGRQCVCGGAIFLHEKIGQVPMVGVDLGGEPSVTVIRATTPSFVTPLPPGGHAADAMTYAFKAHHEAAAERVTAAMCVPGAMLGCAAEPQRPTYQILADKVLPGMLLHGALVEQVWTKTTRGDVQILVHRGGVFHYPVDDTVNVQLPGPSPRELACIGGSFYPYNKLGDEPSAHVACDCGDGRVCPVAPVPGRHGGMRLWPAPWRGEAWSYEGGGTNIGGCGWRSGDLYALQWEVSQAGQPTDRYHARGHADAILQCFYLPPKPQPEHRETTPWAPHAGYERLAVKYG